MEIFPCVDWLTRTATTDVYVTLPNNSRQVWGYLHSEAISLTPTAINRRV